ncbi:zinc finger MYM-type protein 5-like [Pseudomyrmex gracilis]|uniref:zinc finger MYM-type protein 5-like n=1 Tax=Pseudomyrmex gracilis TaxID=219809 RepID=UPI0009949FBB|nr:zinc finger MYM-type protein 5-like [Pseudomyrmex gracilis]
MSKKPSGAEFRKRKADKDREKQKQTGSFLKYLEEEQKPISLYNETSNAETDDIYIESEQLELTKRSNITKIGNQETEMIVINKTPKSHNDCQERIATQQNKNELNSFSLNDISSWPISLNDAVITELVAKGSIQNKEGPFAPAIRNGTETKGQIRTMSSAWFYRQLDNGEKMLRTWMVHSIVDESLYCFCCRLFASKDSKHVKSVFAKDGFRQ